MLSSKAAVAESPVDEFAMSPAPTSTGSPGGGCVPVTSTSRGARDPDSRESNAAPSLLVVVTPTE
jgi:hypothetical protein